MEELLNFVKQNYDLNDIIKFCEINQIDINIQNQNGSTAIHGTAAYNLYEATEALLLLGANPFILDTVGNTALDLAIAGGHMRISSLLLKSYIHYNHPLDNYLNRSIQLAKSRIQHIRNHYNDTELNRKRIEEIEEFLGSIIELMKEKGMEYEGTILEDISSKMGQISSQSDIDDMLSMFEKLSI